MTPGIAFWRFGCSLLLGGCLGLWYGFLRPLGTKHQTLSDVLFSLGAVNQDMIAADTEAWYADLLDSMVATKAEFPYIDTGLILSPATEE